MRYLPLLLLLLVIPVSADYSEDVVVSERMTTRSGDLNLHEHSLYQIILRIVDNPNNANVTYAYFASSTQFYHSNATSEYALNDDGYVVGNLSDEFTIVNYHNVTTGYADDYNLGVVISFKSDANVTVRFELIVGYAAEKRLDFTFAWFALPVLVLIKKKN